MINSLGYAYYEMLVMQGAISGMIGGLVVTLWISVGGAMYAPPTPTLPLGTCLVDNNVTLNSSVVVLPVNA